LWDSCTPGRRSRLRAPGRPGCLADADKAALSVQCAERCEVPAAVRCSCPACGPRISAARSYSPSRARRGCGGELWTRDQSVIPAHVARVRAARAYEDDLGLCIALSVSCYLPVAEDEWDSLGHREASPRGVAQANMGAYTPVPAHDTRGFAIEIDFEGCATAFTGSRLCVFDLAPARVDPSR
jgi:hypothetical protein